MLRNNSFEQSMTPEEQSIVNQKLREVTGILYKNTLKEELEPKQSFSVALLRSAPNGAALKP